MKIERDFFKNKINSKESVHDKRREMWKIVKKLTGKDALSNTVPAMKVGKNLLENEIVIANLFINYFNYSEIREKTFYNIGTLGIDIDILIDSF